MACYGEERLEKLTLDSSSEETEANSDDSFLHEMGSMDLFDSDDDSPKSRLISHSETQDVYDDSSDEDGTDHDKEMRLKFYSQIYNIYNSGGFDVDPDIRGKFIRIFLPYNPNPEESRKGYETVCRFSKMGIEKYNSDNGTNYEFERFVKSMWQLVGGEKYYLTFEAREASDSDPTVFQALVFDGIPPKGGSELIEVILVRKKSSACEKDNDLLFC